MVVRPSAGLITFGIINIIVAIAPPCAGCLGAVFYFRPNEPMPVQGRDLRPQFNQHLEREAPLTKAEAIAAAAGNSCVSLLLVIGAIGLCLTQHWARWLTVVAAVLMILSLCVHDVYSLAILRPTVVKFLDQQGQLPPGPQGDGFKMGFSFGFVGWSCMNPVIMIYLFAMSLYVSLTAARFATNPAMDGADAAGASRIGTGMTALPDIDRTADRMKNTARPKKDRRCLMPSPFPGMNPYLENSDVWQDFHDRFVPALGDALTALVRPNFIVKVEEHRFIHEPSGGYRLIGQSDVSVARPKHAADSNGGTATIISPIMARIPTVDFEKHLFLEVRDRSSRELITVLEMLSPTNKKAGPDREQYLAKRANLLRRNVHFIEIDLLRGWPRMPIENAKECDYAIMVSRVEDRPDVNYWPLRLRDPLPPLPVPLRAPHGNVEVDLQAVLDGVYDRAGYQDYIYQESPEPALSPEDAAWAAALIAAT